jgi:hypothetical protein
MGRKMFEMDRRLKFENEEIRVFKIPSNYLITDGDRSVAALS